MISVREAIRISLSEVLQPAKEKVALLSAANCILAEDIVSDVDMPPFEKSSMDGYALRADDCKSGSSILDIVGIVPAGIYPDFKVGPGQAAKIMTGAPLPEGADSVQMVEKTEMIDGKKVRIEAVRPGQHVARAGEVMKVNSLVLKAGTFISPAVIGVLAAVGKTEIQIYKKPNVAILVTGDELVEIDKKPAGGQIRNTNGYSLYNQVKACGARPVPMGIAKDEMKQLNAMIQKGLQEEVLLISGGVSMGDYDFVEKILVQNNVRIFFEKVNIKPGKPTVFGKTKKALVFGLPGNPVSASTVFEVLVKPVLNKMMGFQNFKNFHVEAILQAPYQTKTMRENYHPAKTFYKDGKFYTVPIDSKGSADILAFAMSNSYLITTANKKEFAAGEVIDVVLRDEFWLAGSAQKDANS